MNDLSEVIADSPEAGALAPTIPSLETAAPTPGASGAVDSAATPVETPPEQADPAEDVPRQILEELRRLGEDFSMKMKYDQAKERLIDALDEEVRRHRVGLHFTLLRPVFLDLISLHDELGKCAESPAADESTARTLRSFASTVEEVLARNGAAAFTNEGVAFDGKRQRAVRTAATVVLADAGHVAEHVRAGFEYEGRLLRPELVVTYRYVEPSEVPNAAEEVSPTIGSTQDA